MVPLLSEIFSTISEGWGKTWGIDIFVRIMEEIKNKKHWCIILQLFFFLSTSNFINFMQSLSLVCYTSSYSPLNMHNIEVSFRPLCQLYSVSFGSDFLTIFGVPSFYNRKISFLPPSYLFHLCKLLVFLSLIAFEISFLMITLIVFCL